MPESNYLVSTTALSTTASGTTIASPTVAAAGFVVARTLVRTAVPAGTFLGTSTTWSIHYVVSAMTTPYNMRLKLQRRNSSGTMQSESGYGTTRSSTGTYDDNLTWASGTWNANDQLALVWEHERPSGSGNKSGTITAGGSSFVSAPVPAQTFFGAVVSPFSFGEVVTPKVTAKSAVALPLAFGEVVNGTRTTRGQVALSVVFGVTGAGARALFGSVALPLTLDELVNGTRALRGQVGLPLSWLALSDGDISSTAMRELATIQPGRLSVGEPGRREYEVTGVFEHRPSQEV